MYAASYKELIVWKKSMLLTREVYHVTEELPKTEQYGMVSQMRRSAVSIPSNVAEGYKRKGLGEYVYFLSVADGSAAEFETQPLLVRNIYPGVNVDAPLTFLEEVQKMLVTMIKKLNEKTKR